MHVRVTIDWTTTDDPMEDWQLARENPGEMLDCLNTADQIIFQLVDDDDHILGHFKVNLG